MCGKSGSTSDGIRCTGARVVAAIDVVLVLSRYISGSRSEQCVLQPLESAFYSMDRGHALGHLSSGQERPANCQLRHCSCSTSRRRRIAIDYIAMHG